MIASKATQVLTSELGEPSARIGDVALESAAVASNCLVSESEAGADAATDAEAVSGQVSWANIGSECSPKNAAVNGTRFGAVVDATKRDV